MLFLLLGVLFTASLLVLCIRKSRESIYLLGMCVSLIIEFTGMLIFIAKKGGFSSDVMNFLYFSTELKLKVQYLFVTLNTIGYLVAVGRSLFPLFLVQMALHYSMTPFIRRHPNIKFYVCIPPAVLLVLYYPAFFRGLIGPYAVLRDFVAQASLAICVLYVVAALGLLIYELFAITMGFCRRQFGLIVVCMASLSGLYLLYCAQDPGQIYSFYSYDYVWYKGLGYLMYSPRMSGYVIIVVVNVICGVLGFASILRYTQGTFVSDRDDIVMERKFDVARSGASVFVHGVKNQLLANRVLEKRLYHELDKETPDMAAIRAGIDALHSNNEMLIERSEELYRTVKSKSVQLVPVTLTALADLAIERFYKKYPDGKVEAHIAWETEVLADKNYFSEALYNLLINGYEANMDMGRAAMPVLLTSHDERLYTVLEVKDNGKGISRADQSKIFEPFYSSKNSNYNWGMGLYHVRAIVKAHLGTLRIESTPGQGTSFFILLPRYGQHKAKRAKL